MTDPIRRKKPEKKPTLDEKKVEAYDLYSEINERMVEVRKLQQVLAEVEGEIDELAKGKTDE